MVATKAEALAARKGYVKGALAYAAAYVEEAWIERSAKQAFPIPEETVPRTIVVGDFEYKFVDGTLYTRVVGDDDESWWVSDFNSLINRLVDLFNNPTETRVIE